METHPEDELFAERSFQNVDVLDLSIDLNWLNDVSIVDGFEGGVDKCFI